MKLGFVKEHTNTESRVAVTPNLIKKMVDMGLSIIFEEGAGSAAGFSDDTYTKGGATALKTKEDVYKESDILVRVSPESTDQLATLKKGCVVIGALKPFKHHDLIKYLKSNDFTSFSMEMMPRITRAQSMDILSSQNNLAGYRSVLEGAHLFGRALPLMMTAAGTIPAAKVLILGAGVAGLQAIATAKRLGAVVSAFDVRTAAKEQVESLGGTFVTVDYEESGDAAGGYAKEMSEGYKKAQAEKLANELKKADIVITTALIPGKPAPRLITKDMIQGMKEGSVIIDLAIETGGNVEGSVADKVANLKGVKVFAPSNILSNIANDASQLFAKNIYNFLGILWDKENKKINLNFEDELIDKSALTHAGKIHHAMFKNLESGE